MFYFTHRCTLCNCEEIFSQIFTDTSILKSSEEKITLQVYSGWAKELIFVILNVLRFPPSDRNKIVQFSQNQL